MSSFHTVQDEIRELTRGPVPIISFPTNTGPFIPLLTNAQPIQGMIKIVGWQYPPPKDPFSLSFEEYSRLTYGEASELQNEVHRRYSDKIDDAWRRGKKQIVICDGKIVCETDSLDDIPNDKIMKLAKKYNNACYVFSTSEMVEESAWTPINEDDDYPTIGIYCGAVDSEESEIVKKSPLINADFDTGNPAYKIFDANQLPESIASFLPPLRYDLHLRRYYPYFEKTVKLCVEDSEGKIHSVVRDIRLVKDWTGSALLQVSPNRVGFVGRDLLRDLKIKVELDPIRKTTQIHGASF